MASFYLSKPYSPLKGGDVRELQPARVQNPDIAHTEASGVLLNSLSTLSQLLWEASQTLFDLLYTSSKATPGTFATKTRGAGSGVISDRSPTTFRRTNKPQHTFPTLSESCTLGWLLSISPNPPPLLRKRCLGRRVISLGGEKLRSVIFQF